MRKKLLTVLFALAAALSLVFAFSACGQNKPDDGGNDSDQVTTDPDDDEKPDDGEQTDPDEEQKPGEGEQPDPDEEQKPDEHTHTFADTWSFDTQYHWHAATCGHDEKSDFGAHNIADGVCTVCGAAFEETEGLKYTPSDDGSHYIVSGMGAATTTDIVVPSTYNDLPVTSIGDSAFKDCTTLTSVTIPDSVTSIGKYAFHSCISLEIVTIGGSVTSIGKYAFYGCSSLTSISIPDSVTSIGDWAFNYCINLTSINIPNSVTSIDEGAFA